jgi:nitrogen fixation NifU-like protein
MYSQLVLDHFQNPRNAGEIADADGSAEVENPACGDVLRITLRVSEGRVSQARFKAQGCVAAIACGSAITELVAGKSLQAAGKIRHEDVSAAVGGLPQASNHAAFLAVETIKMALSRIRL